MKKGRLFLIPVGLGHEDLSRVIPAYNHDIIHKLDEFIVEEFRSAVRFLKQSGYPGDISKVKFHLHNEHTREMGLPDCFASLEQGHDAGLLSESGIPCVADPGSIIVSEAQSRGIRVIPLAGPSSIFMALMASGFNGQSFSFEGYLPVDKHERAKKIRELEKQAYLKDQTQIFIEAPYRNKQLFESIIAQCRPDTMLCVACNISTDNEFIVTRRIADWKKSVPDIQKKNTVFLIYK